MRTPVPFTAQQVRSIVPEISSKQDLRLEVASIDSAILCQANGGEDGKIEIMPGGEIEDYAHEGFLDRIKEVYESRGFCCVIGTSEKWPGETSLTIEWEPLPSETK